MKRLATLSYVVVAAVLCSFAGCKRKGADVAQVARVVDQSFKAAPAETKQVMQASVAAIKAAEGKTEVAAKRACYIDALVPVQNLVARGNLSRDQVQAARQVFVEVNKSVQNDRRLATKEMYQAQSAMAQALYRAGVRP